MATFTLKVLDTRPVLEVALKNPSGSPHDLTGTTDWQLHVQLPGGAVFSRVMLVEDFPGGILSYTFTEDDWDPENVDGALPRVAAGRRRELRMEYEVVGTGDDRLTFPNGSTDTLELIGSIA